MSLSSSPLRSASTAGQPTQRDGVAVRLGGFAGQGVEVLAQQAAAVGVRPLQSVVHSKGPVLECSVAGDPAQPGNSGGKRGFHMPSSWAACRPAQHAMRGAQHMLCSDAACQAREFTFWQAFSSKQDVQLCTMPIWLGV